MRCAGSDQFRTVRFAARPNSGLSDLGRLVRPDYRLAAGAPTHALVFADLIAVTGYTQDLTMHIKALNEHTATLAEHTADARAAELEEILQQAGSRSMTVVGEPS